MQDLTSSLDQWQIVEEPADLTNVSSIDTVIDESKNISVMMTPLFRDSINAELEEVVYPLLVTILLPRKSSTVQDLKPDSNA